jgi:hypothetical protein
VAAKNVCWSHPKLALIRFFIYLYFCLNGELGAPTTAQPLMSCYWNSTRGIKAMETRELKQELALAMACPSECGIGCLGW